MPPLVVTLLLDDAAQERFDALRRQHFPPERNVLAAHVTLFHALPEEQEPRVREDLATAASRPPFPVSVARVRSLGRGVAYDLRSAELARLRAGLARGWAELLTPQDAGKRDAHVTVQNKVDPSRARALLAELSADFAPYEVTAVGLGLWRYVGGPWEPVERYPLEA